MSLHHSIAETSAFMERYQRDSESKINKLWRVVDTCLLLPGLPTELFKTHTEN